MVYCNKCSRLLDNDTKECPYCGSALQTHTETLAESHMRLSEEALAASIVPPEAPSALDAELESLNKLLAAQMASTATPTQAPAPAADLAMPAPTFSPPAPGTAEPSFGASVPKASEPVFGTSSASSPAFGGAEPTVSMPGFGEAAPTVSAPGFSGLATTPSAPDFNTAPPDAPPYKASDIVGTTHNADTAPIAPHWDTAAPTISASASPTPTTFAPAFGEATPTPQPLTVPGARSVDPRATDPRTADVRSTAPPQPVDPFNPFAAAPPAMGMPGGFGVPMPTAAPEEPPVSLGKQVLMYALAMFLPPIGLIVGLVTMGKENLRQREFGRAMVIVVVLQIVFVLISCCCAYSSNMASYFNMFTGI